MGKLVFKLTRDIGAQQMKYACGTDFFRPTMTGAIINAKMGDIACTDSHILVVYPINVIESNIEERVSVPLFIFERKHYFGYEKVNNGYMSDFIFVLDTDIKRIAVYPPNSQDYIQEDKPLLSVNIIEGNPPNYNAVIPTNIESNNNQIVFDLHKIENIKKATKEQGETGRLHGSCVFKQTINDKNKAILFEEVTNPYPIKAILMPFIYE